MIPNVRITDPNSGVVDTICCAEPTDFPSKAEIVNIGLGTLAKFMQDNTYPIYDLLIKDFNHVIYENEMLCYNEEKGDVKEMLSYGLTMTEIHAFPLLLGTYSYLPNNIEFYNADSHQETIFASKHLQTQREKSGVNLAKLFALWHLISSLTSKKKINIRFRTSHYNKISAYTSSITSLTQITSRLIFQHLTERIENKTMLEPYPEYTTETGLPTDTNYVTEFKTPYEFLVGVLDTPLPSEDLRLGYNSQLKSLGVGKLFGVSHELSLKVFQELILSKRVLTNLGYVPREVEYQVNGVELEKWIHTNNINITQNKLRNLHFLQRLVDKLEPLSLHISKYIWQGPDHAMYDLAQELSYIISNEKKERKAHELKEAKMSDGWANHLQHFKRGFLLPLEPPPDWTKMTERYCGKCEESFYVCRDCADNTLCQNC